MRYVEARIDEHQREEAYRIYVTKSLQLIPQNKFITESYSEMIKPKQIETRNSNEIISDVMKNAGLKFGE